MSAWRTRRARTAARTTEHDTTEQRAATDAGVATQVLADPERAAQLAEAFRARRARLEAQRELRRLRDRYWSGQRLIEEARLPIEWWEHPEADPHAVLGLLPGATLEEAAAARRRIAHDCHPDKVGTEGPGADLAMRRMVAANSAYDRIRRALLPY